MNKISKFLFLLVFIFLYIMPQKILANEKVKIGLLVPLSEKIKRLVNKLLKLLEWHLMISKTEKLR